MLSQRLKVEQIAKDAIAYARKIIPQCAIEPNDSPAEYNEKAIFVRQAAERYQQLDKNRRKASESVSNARLFEPNPFLAKVATSIQAAQESHLGNCGELSFLVIEYITNYNISCSPDDRLYAEVFELKNDGNHQFVVINRKKSSDLEKPTEWGEDCYICDPWTQEYYPIKDYQARLKGLKEEKDVSGMTIDYKAVKLPNYDLKYSDINTTLFAEKESKEYHEKMFAKFKQVLPNFARINGQHRDLLVLYSESIQITEEKLGEINKSLDDVDDLLESLEKQELPKISYRVVLELLQDNFTLINKQLEEIGNEIEQIAQAVKVGKSTYPVEAVEPQPKFYRENTQDLFFSDTHQPDPKQADISPIENQPRWKAST